MELKLRKFVVRKLEFGNTSNFSNGVLTINKEEMKQAIGQGGVFSDIEMHIARPGDSSRIINIMDVLQPRVKLGDSGEAYPGHLGSMHLAGMGETNVLEGVALIQTGKRQGIQEGIVDMSGVGARYSAFSSLNNVVLECKTEANLPNQEYDIATRAVLLRASSYLANLTLDLKPDHIEDLSLLPVKKSLKKIVYIYYLQSQGPLRNTFLYGEKVTNLIPTLLHPNEVLDGAIVSGNYIIACQKNPTFMHCHNPIIRELYQRHGNELDFKGVVIANEHSTLEDKKRTAEFAAKLAKQIGADGVVLSQEGGGHADSDLMLCTKACSGLGLSSVMLINEIAGPMGDQPPLVDTTPLAQYVVSTGNNDEEILLEAVENVYGGTSLLNVSDASKEFKTSLGRMYTATNQLGMYTLRAIDY